MNNKKKIIILSSIILGVLVVVLGVTYAVFTYDRTGNNSDLVLGDIYMHYKENNQLMFNNAMPTSIDKYTTYKVNPVMATQEKRVNELTRCVNYFVRDTFDEGSTAESYCKGEGTLSNDSFRLRLYDFYDEVSISLMMSLNIVVKDGSDYVPNPIMQSQQVEEGNELTSCALFYFHSIEDIGDSVSFCKGIPVWDETIQDDLNRRIERSEKYGESFLEDDYGQLLLDAGIILQDGDTYIVNPVMATQESLLEKNELTTCVDYLTNLDLGNSDFISYCRGTGTLEESTFQQNLTDGTYTDTELHEMAYSNIIIPQIKNLPYFEFTITGKNTYLDEDIWFEIVLNHGDKHETRTTRIKDELLRFTLVEVVGEDTEITLFNNRKYDSLSNKRIWVETIKANTKTEINKTYRLYAWISDETVIGNVNEDYTTEEWNDVFASIKVNVTGDFNEKEITYEDIYNVTDASCFATETTTIDKYIHNSNMTDDELNACVNYFAGIPFDEGSTAETFCKGTGTADGMTFQTVINNGLFSEEQLTYLEEENIIIGIPGLSIIYYDSNCGSDVVIPKTINGYNVTEISSYAFESKGLTSVVISNSITTIGTSAFYNNQLTSVTFEENSVLNKIDDQSFFGTNKISKVIIPNSVTILACAAFNSDVEIIKNIDLVCTDLGPR